MYLCPAPRLPGTLETRCQCARCVVCAACSCACLWVCPRGSGGMCLQFRWEHLEKQLPPGVTLQRGLRGFTDHPNFLVARAKKVRGS